MSAPQAWPLQWPAGKPRTPYRDRKAGGFKTGRNPVSMHEAVQRVQCEIDRIIGARSPVLSTNVELRLDGFPRSNRPQPADPGAALYFNLHGDPVALACDTYTTVEQNVAEIAAHLKATRAIERYGVGTFDELFRGFTALPPAMSPDDWRTVLGEPGSLLEAETTYRNYMRLHHPDVGGDEAEAAKWNAAIAKAREALK